ncbi:interleukin-6 receptor subunit alpha [Stegastes partitus]|uniref:Interleukin-6 receptor subunit alpha-like n=1 Tax=Stegastes partitus TaxID=144197 RepID=A0A3B4ZB63_9TELE|nr:PREDICTED: interleukin-6 receptor subunit alpha-like [Stegastes partitus]
MKAADMRVFLPVLCALCALCVPTVRGIFAGMCPRKDPPPGVLVLSPGSELVLTCSGHVKVDGLKVGLSRSSDAGRSAPSVRTTTQKVTSNSAVSGQVSPAPGEDRRYTEDTGRTDSPHVVHPTSNKLDSDWTDEEVIDYEDEDEEEEEEEEGGRVTRGIKSRPQWRWNKMPMGSGDKDWGDFTFGRSEATLSLSSVRLEDSGKYSCHRRGQERFTVKVIVTDPLESPNLFCYKRSPSSKIRCEATLQKSVMKQPQCFLSLSKSIKGNFRQLPCSYSHQHSRCWCALDHIDDDVRTLHMAFLCVTGITGNATSNLQQFTPLTILMPDPPSNVSVHQKEGQETWMQVTWNSPASWKQQDSHYHLIYELKYWPAKSSFYHEQVVEDVNRRSYTITDAMPGVEYLIQLRARDEFDGQWSNWSSPFSARSWTAESTLMDDAATTMLSDTAEGTGSGAEWDFDVSPTEPDAVLEVSPHVLWISAVFAFLSVILAAYIFRHKDRFMSKLHNLIPRCGDSSPPPPSSVPGAPEVQVLMTFASPVRKEPAGSDTEEGEGEENEEGETARETTDVMHFNNTSYFLLQRE